MGKDRKYLEHRSGLVLSASAQYGSGSGFFIEVADLDLCLVTARHVAIAASVTGQVSVGNATALSWSYSPKEIWIDRSTDLALMRVFESSAIGCFQENDLETESIAGAKCLAFGLPGFRKANVNLEQRTWSNLGAFTIDGDERPHEDAGLLVLPIREEDRPKLGNSLGGMSGAPLMGTLMARFAAS